MTPQVVSAFFAAGSFFYNTLARPGLNSKPSFCPFLHKKEEKDMTPEELNRLDEEGPYATHLKYYC